MFEGEEGGTRAGGDADFVVDVLDMAIDRLGGDVQLGSDGFDRLAAREQPQHFHFALAETGYQLAPGGGGSLSGGGQHGVDGFVVQPPGFHFASEFFGGLFGQESRSVGALFAFDLIKIRGDQNPRRGCEQ